MKAHSLRTRWSAIGAAVAVSMGAGGLGLVHATSSTPSPLPVYIAISPCRLVDTRADSHVGDLPSALIAEQTVTLAGTAAHGDCNVPAGASALAMNVTAVDATAPTFIQFAPGGTLVPANSSSLNPIPGAPPTPNGVNTALAANGTFDMYNLAGTVEIIIDVVGYYDDHLHSVADVTNESGIAFINETSYVGLTATPAVVATVSIRPPSAGFVTVHASAAWSSIAIDRYIRCQITDGTSTINYSQVEVIDTDANSSLIPAAISTEQTFAVSAYTGPVTSGRPFNLVCRSNVGTAEISEIQMTATFHASSYAPLSVVASP